MGARPSLIAALMFSSVAAMPFMRSRLPRQVLVGGALSLSVGLAVTLAEPHERAGLLSGFFALSYLAFSVPAMLAGLAAGYFGLQTVVMSYGAILIVLIDIALLSMRREA